MITYKGIAYFLNRLINNNISVIDKVVLGTGGKTPTENDTRLTNQTISKPCTPRIDLKNRRLIVNIELTSTELENIAEIGVTSNGELLTHDLIDKPKNKVTSNINLEYIIEFEDSFVINQRSVWSEREGYYYIYQPDFVKGVTEVDIDSGYKRVNNEKELSPGTYYYDMSREILYIRTIDNKSPETKNIQIIID